MQCLLYRDDELIVCEGTPRYIEQNKKQICNFLRKFNFSIKIEANKRVVNFLIEATFNLTNQSYKLYTKPGNTILCVHKQSDHPPAVLKKPTSLEVTSRKVLKKLAYYTLLGGH